MIKFYYFKFTKKNDLGYPYTYDKLLSKHQFYNSYQIMMMVKNQFGGIARLHYIDKHTFELGDFFIVEKLRGKQYKKIKFSQHLINETIKYSTKINKKVKQITLAVDNKNIAAIKLYKNNNFIKFTNKKPLLQSTKKTIFQYMLLTL